MQLEWLAILRICTHGKWGGDEMTSIAYRKGDATAPVASGAKIICHVCNDIGGWGKGFVLAISKRWPEPEAHYRAWYKQGESGGAKLAPLIRPRLPNWQTPTRGATDCSARLNARHGMEFAPCWGMTLRTSS